MRGWLHGLLAFLNRAAAVARRRRIRQSIDEELDFHLAMRQAREQHAGLATEEARRVARRRFGNRTAIAEETREMWTFPSFESMIRDVRFALRSLRKAPAFAAVIVGTLALAIGANTAIFSLVDAILVRGLPYPEAERLVVLVGNVQRETIERRGGSYPDYLDWKAQARHFEGMAAYDSLSMTLAGNGDPDRLALETVSAGYFDVLGVAPIAGRTFQDSEDQGPGSHRVVVLGHALWQQRFGGDTGVIGRTIRLGANAYEVIGVMPPGFAGITDQATMWIPFTLGGYSLDERGSRGFQVIARLKAGATLAQAQSDLDVISARLEAAYPATNEKRGVEVSPLTAETFGQIQPVVLALMAAVGCVLLIACANVANLLVGRSEARQQEIAIRTALGAGRLRLLRQLVTESLVLTALGGLAGIGLAHVALRLLVASSPVTLPSFVQPSLDTSVLLFTAAISLACGLLLGIAPAAHARAGVLHDALKSTSRGSSGTHSRVRSALVVAEVTLAVVLVIAAGLLIRTVRNLTAVDPGYDTAPLLTLNVGTPRGLAAADAPADAPPLPFVVSWRQLLEQIEAVPGVASASLASDLPLQGGGSAIFYTAEGDATTDAESRPRAYVHRITPGFFETLGVPMVAGRTFEPAELNAESTAVIVSERVTRRFWPGLDAIGRRIKPGGPSSPGPWFTIVGVVPDLKYRALPDNPTQDPDLYFPYVDRPVHALLIRAENDPVSVTGSVREAIRRLSDQTVTYNVAPMRDVVDGWTAQSRFTGWLMAVFAATALLLAVIGIYGVMSYLVSQRTREFGIRLALGARPVEIVRGVMRQAAWRIASGVILGAAAALAVTRWMEALLFGVSTTSPAAFAPILLLAAVALLACAVPAVRASRIAPVEALRTD